MELPRLSVIIPTCGRPSLYATLHSVWMNGIHQDDEVIVVGDGSQPEARRICEVFKDRLPIQYHETNPSKCVGAVQRNCGMAIATGAALLFMDDDDVYVNGGVGKARNGAADHPGKVLLYRMRATPKRLPYDLLWASPKFVLANFSTQMMVVPNVKERLGIWPSQACSDFEFLKTTMEKYPEGIHEIVWKEDVIAEIH